MEYVGKFKVTSMVLNVGVMGITTAAASPTTVSFPEGTVTITLVGVGRVTFTTKLPKATSRMALLQLFEVQAATSVDIPPRTTAIFCCIGSTIDNTSGFGPGRRNCRPSTAVTSMLVPSSKNAIDWTYASCNSRFNVEVAVKDTVAEVSENTGTAAMSPVTTFTDKPFTLTVAADTFIVTEANSRCAACALRNVMVLVPGSNPSTF